MADVLTEDSCKQLCNALRQLHGPANFICGSFDWAATTGQCCLNPPGPGRFLRSDDSSFSHSVKVADGASWKCPASSGCPANNSDAACGDYSGSFGQTVVGHELGC